MTRRILIAGISTYWGGRLAQALEGFEEVEAIIGIDSVEPRRELERTEFVKVTNQHSLLSRIVRAAEIDTVVDSRLTVNSVTDRPRSAHDNNVIGTMNIVTACAGSDSPVRKFIFKSSTHYYGSEQDDPAFFLEAMRRPHTPRTPLERDIGEAEGAVAEFAEKHPGVEVTVLRCANVLGPDVDTAFTRMFALPVVPMVLGFDPRLQFVHEIDVVRAIMFVFEHDIDGTFNVAGDGLLPWSEVAAMCDKRLAPLPPVGRGLVGALLTRVGIDMPPELVDLLTYGRGVDNRRLKQAGFEYCCTSAGAVRAFAEAARLRGTIGDRVTYRYERDVEQFFRHSPAVVRDHGG